MTVDEGCQSREEEGVPNGDPCLVDGGRGSEDERGFRNDWVTKTQLLIIIESFLISTKDSRYYLSIFQT